jgi:hypothetical protein
LREENHSYVWVARSLGLKRAHDARQAFLRALAKRGGPERDALRRRELQRLDELEARIRRRDESEPDKLAGRLVALDRLRQNFLNDDALVGALRLMEVSGQHKETVPSRR